MIGTLLAIGLLAQSPVQKQAQAARADTPPVIDGVPDEAVWRDAPVLGGFIQFEPRRGEAAGERTDARVLYDDAAVYIAFRVWESGSVTAQLTRRDADLMSDDAVVVVLDTYRDRQSGYVFVTNALGTQQDGRIASDGRTVDFLWDETWESAASLNDSGWTAELAIPFAALRYRAGQGRTWGINLGRSRRSTLEVSFWSGPLDNRYRVSGAGELAGLDLPVPERRRQFITYGLSRFQEGEPSDWDAGADLRYALSPAMSLNGTVNPDFATIEADQEQVNLTRFELSLSEKRPFFLEGAELFRQRIRTFYTRRISDIGGGAKLLGKQGPWTMAALGVGSERTGSVAPAFYGVTRFQRDVGRSSIAAMWAGRQVGGEGRGSASLDATLFFTPVFGFTGQLIESYGPHGDGSMAFFVRPSYDSPTGHFHVRYTHLGSNFADNANAVGFIRDDDRREVDSAIEKTFWIRSGTLERFQYDSNYNAYWSQTGTLRSWKIDESVSLDLRNRWALEVEHTEEFKRFEKDFRNRSTGIRVGYNTREYQSVSARWATGKNFDADFQLVTASARFKPLPSSALEYGLTRLALDPDPDDESTWIHVVRANHFFTNDLFLQLFYQSNTVIDRNNIQAVFVWRYLPPFGTLQLAFQRGTARFGEASQQGNTLFLKASTVF